MEKKEKGTRKLLIRKEVLRDLSPAELIPVAGGRTKMQSDFSNCCCGPTDTCP